MDSKFRSLKKPKFSSFEEDSTGAISYKVEEADEKEIFYNILLIESDHIQRRELTRRLEQEFDCSIEAYGDGREAYRKLKSHDFLCDLIICDVNSFGLNGFGLLNSVRNDPETERLPFLMTCETGDYEEARYEKAIESGANGFIKKPVDFDELYHQIFYLLDLSIIARKKRNLLVTALPGSRVGEVVSQVGKFQLGGLEVTTDEVNLMELLAEGPSISSGWESSTVPRPEWNLWIEVLVGASRSAENLVNRWRILRSDSRYHTLPLLVLHSKDSTVVKDFKKDILGDRLLELYEWPCSDERLASVVASLFKETDKQRRNAIMELRAIESFLEKHQYIEAERMLRSLEVVPNIVTVRILISKALIGQNRLLDALLELEMGLDCLFQIWKARSLLPPPKHLDHLQAKESLKYLLRAEELKQLVWLADRTVRVALDLGLQERGLENLQKALQVAPDYKALQRVEKIYEAFLQEITKT